MSQASLGESTGSRSALYPLYPKPFLKTHWFLWDWSAGPAALVSKHQSCLSNIHPRCECSGNNKLLFEQVGRVCNYWNQPLLNNDGRVQQVLQSRSVIIFIMCEEERTQEGTQGQLSKQSKWWKWDQFMTSCFALIRDVWMYQEMK